MDGWISNCCSVVGRTAATTTNSNCLQLGSTALGHARRNSKDIRSHRSSNYSPVAALGSSKTHFSMAAARIATSHWSCTSYFGHSPPDSQGTKELYFNLHKSQQLATNQQRPQPCPS